jgi:hypothetical protein
MSKWIAIGLLIVATIASWIIAVSVDLDKYELGALINLIYPPVFGMLTILTFLIVDWCTNKIRVPLTIMLCLANIAFAFYIR